MNNKSNLLNVFDHVWVVDFEFSTRGQKYCVPWCMVAKDILSGNTVRTWLLNFEGDEPPRCPINFSHRKSLFVSFSATAEIGVILDLQWPEPVFVCDLFAEWRRAKNGVPGDFGSSLVAALEAYNLYK